MPNGGILAGMTKADDYRKRAALTRKSVKKRGAVGSHRTGLENKAKALADMADNEDWLDGKSAPKKPKGPMTP